MREGGGRSPTALCERIKITGQQKLFAALGGDGWPLSSANNSHKSSFELRVSALNLILVVDTLHHVIPQPWPVLASRKVIPVLMDGPARDGRD